jgi:isoleucyl-tRNA synthetase
LDIVKDRLYCEGTASKTRRAAQTTLYSILEVLVHLMAPILSFTAEEIWQYLPDKRRALGSVFLSQIPQADPELNEPQLAEKWDRIFRERSEVLKALEQARAAGIIGHSLDAKIVFEPRNGDQSSILKDLIDRDRTRLQDLLIVSQASSVTVAVGTADGNGTAYDATLLGCRIAVTRAEGAKCERCWKYDTKVGADASHPTLCPRCAAVLRAGVSV